MTKTGKSKRGFASMSPERRKEIASKGGKAVAPENRSFAKDRTLAASAGRKGGLAVDPENRAYTRDRSLAQAAGRKGGKAAREKKNGGDNGAE